jgi:hypothetical protein
MFKCQICGKSIANSQGLAGHRWLKHGGKTGQEGVLVQGTAAQQAQAAQSQGQGSPAMVQVTASYLAQLQQQAQQAQPAQQGQGLASADRIRGTNGSTLKTVSIDPIVEAYFDYAREKGYDNDLSDFITECVQEFFHNRGIRLRLFTPA